MKRLIIYLIVSFFLASCCKHSDITDFQFHPDADLLHIDSLMQHDADSAFLSYKLGFGLRHSLENRKNKHITLHDLVILSFIGFRIKEEAEILGISENTVGKYRSNIRKKAGKTPVFDIL